MGTCLALSISVVLHVVRGSAAEKIGRVRVGDGEYMYIACNREEMRERTACVLGVRQRKGQGDSFRQSEEDRDRG